MPSHCPICGKPVAPLNETPNDAASRHFPFCGERCRLIDLGRWLDGRYQIPVVSPEAEDDDIDISAPPE